MNIIVETRTVTFTKDANQKIVPLLGGHTNIPVVTATLVNDIGANFNSFVTAISTTSAIVRLSANAPLDLNVKVHAISRA